MKLWLALYSFLHLIALPFIVPWELRKRTPRRRFLWLKEKFTLSSLQPFPKDRKILWVHAVSLGEVKAVANFLKRASAEFNLILTVTTETGRNFAEALSREIPNLRVHYLPFDLSALIKRFVRKYQPSTLIIVETEIWPNLIATASKDLPTFLINGRLSEKSFKGYQKFPLFFRQLLNSLTGICVQNEDYLLKFILLGYKADKLYLTGNLKFDLTVPWIIFPSLEALERPIIIAGSTHDPEEKIILQAFLEVPEAKTLLIVPRHPERFTKVYRICKEMAPGSPVFLYTELDRKGLTLGFQPRDQKLVIVIDQIGVLASLYRLADIAIIGGSFIPHGGQNPLEAIYWKVPVVVGPFMANFPFIDEFIRRGAVLQIKPKELARVLRLMLQDEGLRRSLGEKAFEIFKGLSGATQRTLEIIKKFL